MSCASLLHIVLKIQSGIFGNVGFSSKMLNEDPWVRKYLAAQPEFVMTESQAGQCD